MKHLFYLVTCIGLTFVSCKEYPCSKATGHIYISGFSINETDTVIVRKFAKSTNFATPLNSFILDTLISSFIRNGNGLEICCSLSFGTDNGLLSTYDYEIYLPKPNRLFQISEIVEEQKSRKSGIAMDKVGCINSFSSYKVNGQQTVTTSDNSYYIGVSK